MGERKYYWLKLKEDFFKRHDIRIIESMDNGKEYVLFYLKLLLESISHEGKLRFSDAIPYNEKMLSTITDTNVDIVRSALKVLKELSLIEILDDQTLFMSEINNNNADNLEWCTHSENTIHSFKNGLQKKVHNQYGIYEVKKYVY